MFNSKLFEKFTLSPELLSDLRSKTEAEFRELADCGNTRNHGYTLQQGVAVHVTDQFLVREEKRWTEGLNDARKALTESPQQPAPIAVAAADFARMRMAATAAFRSSEYITSSRAYHRAVKYALYRLNNVNQFGYDSVVSVTDLLEGVFLRLCKKARMSIVNNGPALHDGNVTQEEVMQQAEVFFYQCWQDALHAVYGNYFIDNTRPGAEAARFALSVTAALPGTKLYNEIARADVPLLIVLDPRVMDDKWSEAKWIDFKQLTSS